jgi:hypothetical protein
MTKNTKTPYRIWREQNIEAIKKIVSQLDWDNIVTFERLLLETYEEGSKYVSGVETLINEGYDNMTEEEKQEAQEYNYWIAEQQIAEQDARYQYENPENTLTNR